VTIATRISRYFVALPVDILLKKIIYLGGFQVSDKILFLVFFISAQMCLGCSTLFHTLNCHSKPVRAIFHRLDYAGIVILIVGSVIPWLYYGFYCQFYLKWIYISAVGVFGFITLILIMWEKFNKPAFRVYRAIVFVTLALVSALPILQFLYVNGYTESITKGSINKTLLMGALYISGAVLYAARIPERFMPGKCDIWFQSHQIFHVLVVAAAFVHYYAISDMAMYRFTQGPYCPDTIPEES
jgi:adiponectin receptor